MEPSISAIVPGEKFHGQNANYPGNVPQYVDNGDGTVTDMESGLMWQSSFDHNGDGFIDYADKLSYDAIFELPVTPKAYISRTIVATVSRTLKIDIS